MPSINVFFIRVLCLISVMLFVGARAFSAEGGSSSNSSGSPNSPDSPPPPVKKSQKSAYPGVVKVVIPGNIAATGFVTGSPHAGAPPVILTSFHVLEPLADFKYPFYRSKDKVPLSSEGLLIGSLANGIKAVEKIKNMDSLYNLSALKLPKDFKPRAFYPVEDLNMDTDIDFLKEVEVVGFPEGELKVVKGKLLKDNTFGDKSFMRIEIKDERYLYGLTGAPVFFEGKLIGMVVKADNVGLFIVSVDRLRQFLQKPDMDCAFVKCIKEEQAMLVERGTADNRMAQFILGAKYYQSKDYGKAHEWLR